MLTIIGYSMNDTVVVFDRLRENLRKYKSMPLADVIDLSINETLSRTMITAITAFLAAAGALVFGGQTLYGFAIAMTVRHRHRHLFVDLCGGARPCSCGAAAAKKTWRNEAKSRGRPKRR